MNLQAIVITNCIGFTILMILLTSSYLVRQRRQDSDNLFTAMIIITASSCIMEMITFIFDGADFAGVRLVNLLTNSWLYLSNVFVSASWYIYVDLRLYHDEKRIRKHWYKSGFPAIAAIIGILCNLKFQFLFSIDENAVYHRRPLGYAYYAVTFGYLLASIIKRHRYNKLYGKNTFFPIFMFLTPIFIGATVQFLFYGLSIGWCCTAMGLTGIYMSLQNELSYIDPLTKLYNRNYLDHIIGEISRKSTHAGGIMIDLDYFKAINDNFGHAAGDEALIDAALIIRKSIPEKAIPVRFAGDEFIIIMQNADESQMISIRDHLKKSITAFNQEAKKPYQLSFSIGYSLYQPGSPADTFLGEMDNQMYEEKKTKHSRSSGKMPNPA